MVLRVLDGASNVGVIADLLFRVTHSFVLLCRRLLTSFRWDFGSASTQQPKYDVRSLSQPPSFSVQSCLIKLPGPAVHFELSVDGALPS